jgi:glycosyltransferase involved in cell wall biosynthesis
VNPTITAVIPAYNCQRWLGAAIESCLTQTRPPDEILVMDDASTDATCAVARGYPGVRVIENAVNVGQAANRNRAVAAARSAYIAFLDADDLWLPHKLERQLGALARDSGAAIVMTHVQQFLTPEHEGELRGRYAVPAVPQPGFIPSTMLMSKKTFHALNGFSPDWRIAEAVDFLIRAYQQDMQIVVLPETLAQRRIHGNNLGIRMQRFQQEYPALLKAKLDRERRMGQGRP